MPGWDDAPKGGNLPRRPPGPPPSAGGGGGGGGGGAAGAGGWGDAPPPRRSAPMWGGPHGGGGGDDRGPPRRDERGPPMPGGGGGTGWDSREPPSREPPRRSAPMWGGGGGAWDRPRSPRGGGPPHGGFGGGDRGERWDRAGPGERPGGPGPGPGGPPGPGRYDEPDRRGQEFRGDRRDRDPLPRRPDGPPVQRDSWDQRRFERDGPADRREASDLPPRPPGPVPGAAPSFGSDVRRPDMPRKRDHEESDGRQPDSPKRARSSGWDAPPPVQQSASSLPPRPAGPAPIKLSQAAAAAASAIKQQTSPVRSLELKLTGRVDSTGPMSPPAASPTSSPSASVFTPGGTGPMGATKSTTKIGILNLIKQVDTELAVKKKEMDAVKKAWKAKQDDFEERRQEHDDAEEQLLQAIEEKKQREEAAAAGKRKRQEEEEDDVEDQQDESEFAADDDVDDADGTFAVAKRIAKENAARAKKAARLSGRINKLWHADMKKDNRSMTGRPLYESPSETTNYQLVSAQHVEIFADIVSVVRARKAAEAKGQRKLAKQWAKLQIKFDAKPKKKTKTARGVWEEPPLTPRAGAFVRSEAEFQSIIAQLGVDKTATVPDMEPPQLRIPNYESDNGLVLDCAKMLEEQALINQWSEEERSVFFDKFLQFERHPERFNKIAQALGSIEGLGRKKNHGDVVRYYYQNKKKPVFSKEVSRRRSKKNLLKQAQAAERKKAAPEVKDKASKAKAKAKKSPKGPNRSPARSDTDQSEDESNEDAAHGAQEGSDGDQDSDNRQHPRPNKAYWTVAEEQIFVGIYKEFHTAKGRTLRDVAANSATVDFDALTEQFEHSKSDVQLRNLWQKYDERLLAELQGQGETSDGAMTDEDVLEQMIADIRAEKQKRKQGAGSTKASPIQAEHDSPGSRLVEPKVEHEADDDIATREAAVLNLLMAAESSDNSEATAAAALLNASAGDSPTEQPQVGVKQEDSSTAAERAAESEKADSSTAAILEASTAEAATEKVAIKREHEETRDASENEDIATDVAPTDRSGAEQSAEGDDMNEDDREQAAQNSVPKQEAAPHARADATQADADRPPTSSKDIGEVDTSAAKTAAVITGEEEAEVAQPAEAETKRRQEDGDATAMDVDDRSGATEPLEKTSGGEREPDAPAADADAEKPADAAEAAKLGYF